ncbi:MAG: hypothetical protein ABFR75_04580 [Acidobacteriota bacterium]
MESFFLYLMIFFAMIFVVATIMIFDFLKKNGNGEKVSFFWIRLKMISYANKYRDITLKKSGTTGPLFYLWIASINLALISFLMILYEKAI